MCGAMCMCLPVQKTAFVMRRLGISGSIASSLSQYSEEFSEVRLCRVLVETCHIGPDGGRHHEKGNVDTHLLCPQ
jgi:hypothetical protein